MLVFVECNHSRLMWDAVPVCLLVEGKEIKWYKNIEIPDDLKKLEYKDFKFDVPLNGTITFKIIFEPGVLPEEFSNERGRRTRNPMEAPVVVLNEASTTMPVEEVAEVDHDSSANIAIQDYPIDQIPEVHAVGGEVTIIMENQVSEKVAPATITVNKGKDAPTANPGVEMPPKLLGKIRRK